MTPWCNYKHLAKLPRIGDPQFMDLDRRVVLLSKHPTIKLDYKCSDKTLKKMNCAKLHNFARGMYFKCDPRKDASLQPSYHVIYIDHLIHGDKKLLSTIIHEVSHLVDSIILDACVKKIDTEVRAYMIQYYTEHIFCMLDFSFPTDDLTVRQVKWGRKLIKIKAKLITKLNLKHSGELYTKVTAKQIKQTGIKNVEMMFQSGPKN